MSLVVLWSRNTVAASTKPHIEKLTPANCGRVFCTGELLGLLLGVAAALLACLDSTFGVFFFVSAISAPDRLELLLQQLSLSLQAHDLLGIGQRLSCRWAESQETGAEEGAYHQAL